MATTAGTDGTIIRPGVAFAQPRKTTDSSKIRNTFMTIMTRLEAERSRENLIFPPEMMWLIGPPKSGKTTLGLILSDQMGFENDPIPMRTICRGVIARNDGKLVIAEILEELIVSLLEAGKNGGVVIDDFVSITCARVLPFLFEYIRELGEDFPERTAPKFKFCILYASQKTSLERQQKNNENFNAEQCIKLYQKFYKRTQQVVDLLTMYFKFNVIDANGTLTQTQIIALAEINSETNGSWDKNACLKDALSNNPTISARSTHRVWTPRKYQTGRGGRGGRGRGRGRERRGRGRGRGRGYNSQRRNSYESNHGNNRQREMRWSLQDYQQQQDYFHNGIRGQQHYSHQHDQYNYDNRMNSPRQFQRPSGSNNVVRNDSYVTFLQDSYLQPQKSALFSKIKNLEDQVNSILDPSENKLLLQNLEKSINMELQINKLPVPHMVTADGHMKLNSEEYMIQYHVPGQNCMLYWSAGGLCYFVDAQCNFLELASNQYRNPSIGQALLDGVLLRRNGKNVFVINDVAMKSNNSCRGAWLEERGMIAKEIVSSLGDLEKAPISVVFNAPKMMDQIDWEQDLSEVQIGGTEVHCNGWIAAPMKTKFQFSKSNPAYIWSPSVSPITREKFLSVLQY